MAKTTIRKNYSVIIPGKQPIIIRQTTTVNHAIKHAAYLSELKAASRLSITVSVIDNRTNVTVMELPAIDAEHAIKPTCKRDKRYAKLAAKTRR